MARPKGVKNKPKEMVSPQLAKLTAIAMDPSQDAETRADAATALQAALAPPVSEPQAPLQRKGFIDQTTNKWMCACDMFSPEGECADCRAEWAVNPRNPKNKPQAAAPQDSPEEVAAFEIELAELEHSLGDLL